MGATIPRCKISMVHLPTCGDFYYGKCYGKYTSSIEHLGFDGKESQS